jgi:hypothetical protein
MSVMSADTINTSVNADALRDFARKQGEVYFPAGEG